MTDRIDIENIAIARAVQADPQIRLLARYLHKLADPARPQAETPILFVKQAYTLAKDKQQREVFNELMSLLED